MISAAQREVKWITRTSGDWTYVVINEILFPFIMTPVACVKGGASPFVVSPRLVPAVVVVIGRGPTVSGTDKRTKTDPCQQTHRLHEGCECTEFRVVWVEARSWAASSERTRQASFAVSMGPVALH